MCKNNKIIIRFVDKKCLSLQIKIMNYGNFHVSQARDA